MCYNISSGVESIFSWIFLLFKSLTQIPPYLPCPLCGIWYCLSLFLEIISPWWLGLYLQGPSFSPLYVQPMSCTLHNSCCTVWWPWVSPPQDSISGPQGQTCLSLHSPLAHFSLYTLSSRQFQNHSKPLLQVLSNTQVYVYPALLNSRFMYLPNNGHFFLDV